MSSKVFVLILCLGIALPVLVFAQSNPATNPADEKARVFITDSQSWEIGGGGGGSSSGFGGGERGGARPQTAEIIKTFGERCPQVTVNNKKDKADYIVLLDHEGGKNLFQRDNKVAVFNKDGDSIMSHSTSTLGNAVKDACEAIAKDWPKNAARLRTAETNPAPASNMVSSVGGAAPRGPSVGKISVSSTPEAADIEIDGSFVGNTPSTIELAPGEHDVVIKKSGYQTWQRKMKITGGNINLAAELEKAQ